MVTIREIAQKTGYSTSTISRVLNHHPYVSAEKRAKILQVMAELDYRPNQLAQNLSRGASRNIGVIIPYVDNPFFEKMTNGIMARAFEFGYKVTLLPTNYNKQVELAYLEEFSAKAYDGLIITSKANPLKTILAYEKYGPLIFCEYVAEANVPCAYLDRSAALLQAFSYFKDHHCHQIGITVGRSEQISPSTQLTLKIAQQELPHFKLTHVVRDCTTEQDGQQAAKYFQQQPEINGILANGDEIAAGIIEGYSAKKPPLIVSQDNLLIGKFLHFSSIDQHPEQCGQQAFDLFKQGRQNKVMIPHKFIARS
ncbi:LacI family DNA-binding transcriptional regulator [Lapidilactobacillus wuchangensis]|uniref:LacI family DNA-binding transcriptional regulator n=1 Tax=Lapidilactobacillus wuchangensis TaxID=2486001 RepID=UPI000F76CCDB|nr:LacI family DNA-binding transcriptional regulator [Lapidilactobacillus wuchangensis]